MTKPKFYLPLVQTALAALLMLLSWRKQPWSTGSTLECAISYGINAPVAFIGPLLAKIRLVAINRVPWFIASYLLYLTLVAILWYVVALEMSGTGGSTLMARLASRKAVRRTADLFLVAFGLAFVSIGSVGLGHWHEAQFKDLPIVIGVLTWGVVIAMFYGWDFWMSIRPPHHTPPHLAAQ